MSNIKFELTDNTRVNFMGVTLYQIRATEDIPARGVRKGDLGGWVESAELTNGDARVSGDAWVYGNAEVYGNARVSGNARVYGDADIERTWHYLVVQQIGSESVTATLYRTKNGGHTLNIGCWREGSLGTLMAEVKRRRKQWTADEATQEIWFEQYRALKKLGKATIKRWEETK